ncbi:ead/Ea22-like family protein [Stutzerimonas stutzeri]|uniref:ead/Ea22-like family protein n=1 Tax=Stutzerimonas stutzeri TaxID=316 RepID=UPI000C9A0DEF|nr:ead/Ea22-like family protein [Stutzerimonas stutzeri]PNG11892.1 hypothetical protein CXK97_19410 [Stutzerimonas stutzeri]
MSKYDELKRLAEAATPGPWEWGGTPVATAEEALEICRVNIELTANPDPYFCEVYVEDGRRTALVGNGPTGQQNAAFIAAANPAAILSLIAEVEGLERWKKEAVDVMSPVLDYAEGLKVAKPGQSVTQALIADHKRLHAEHQFELERHRTTWTQLDQAKREIEQLKVNAARYEWLRLADWWRHPICVIRNPKEQAKLGSDCPSGERLDEAVDAAMQEAAK